MIERRLEAPFALLFARAGGKRRLDLRRPQLALAQADFGHRLDDWTNRIAVGCPRHVAEAVGLRAEAHAVDRR
jgi:hypothetical protein